jgi:hypothetical protein
MTFPLWLLWMAVPAAHAGDDALASLPVPSMTVCSTPRPPTIDGKLVVSQWRYASATSGFLNLADGNLADEKTVVQVTFDAQKVYFAFQCTLTSERMPRAVEMQRDGGVAASLS